MQAPSAEVKVAVEVHSEVKEGMCTVFDFITILCIISNLLLRWCIKVSFVAFLSCPV